MKHHCINDFASFPSSPRSPENNRGRWVNWLEENNGGGVPPCNTFQRSWKLNLNNGWPFTTIAQIEDVYLWDQNNSNCLFDHLLTDTNSTNKVTLCTQLCRIFCLKKTTNISPPVGTKFTQGRIISNLLNKSSSNPSEWGNCFFWNELQEDWKLHSCIQFALPKISNTNTFPISWIGKSFFFPHTHFSASSKPKNFMDKIVGTKLGEIGLAVKVFLFSDLFRGLFFPDILQDFILASQNGFQSLHSLGWKPNKIHLTLKSPWIFGNCTNTSNSTAGNCWKIGFYNHFFWGGLLLRFHPHGFCNKPTSSQQTNLVRFVINIEVSDSMSRGSRFSAEAWGDSMLCHDIHPSSFRLRIIKRASKSRRSPF